MAGSGSGTDAQDTEVTPSAAPGKGTALNMQNTLDFYRVKGRDYYKYQGRTLNQINLPIYDNVYTLIAQKGVAGFIYNSSTILYTKPDSTYSPWAGEITVGDGNYTNGGTGFVESDYWSDPRFNSNCCYVAAEGIHGKYTMIYRKESDNHLWIASASEQAMDDERWSDDVDLGGNIKWVLLLVAGGGGGGAAGYYYVRPSPQWEYISAGGGGGGGACAFLAAQVSSISTSDTPANAYKKNCLLIVRGSGGAGGTGSTRYNEDVPGSIPDTVWGEDGGTTYIYQYRGGTLSESIAIPGGGGGGGRAYAYDSGKAVSYRVSYKAGTGATFDGSAYQTGSLRVLHKSSSSDYAVSNGASGSAGRCSIHTGTGNVWETDYLHNIAFNATSGTHTDDDYGKDGGAVSAISARIKTKNSSASSNILYNTETHDGGLNTYSFRWWVKGTSYTAATYPYSSGYSNPYYGGAGGASALGNGGGYARDTSYYCGKQECVYNNVTLKYGGGGAGGCVTKVDIYGASAATVKGQDGADGYVGIWYPDPLLTTTPRAETFLNPRLNASYEQGAWYFSITNRNSFSVICHRRHEYNGRDYIDEEFEISANGTQSDYHDFDGDTVYVFFSVDGVVNASEVISHTFDSDESTEWEED
jgi:hypothetical protein